MNIRAQEGPQKLRKQKHMGPRNIYYDTKFEFYSSLIVIIKLYKALATHKLIQIGTTAPHFSDQLLAIYKLYLRRWRVKSWVIILYVRCVRNLLLWVYK